MTHVTQTPSAIAIAVETQTALWEDFQASRLIYECDPTPRNKAIFRAHYEAFQMAFSDKSTMVRQ